MSLIKNVEKYYNEKIETHGISAEGVDWKNEDVQVLRFDQLFKLIESDLAASVLDVGCGYGAFLKYARARGFTGPYIGVDVSQKMIDQAILHCKDDTNAQFITGALSDMDAPANYVIASGIFNVRLKTETSEWQDYVFETLDAMNVKSTRGMAFNCLTSYVDYTEDKLFYLNPTQAFDHCKTHYAKDVALLHDYGLYEFTLHVRK